MHEQRGEEAAVGLTGRDAAADGCGGALGAREPAPRGLAYSGRDRGVVHKRLERDAGADPEPPFRERLDAVEPEGLQVDDRHRLRVGREFRSVPPPSGIAPGRASAASAASIVRGRS